MRVTTRVLSARAARLRAALSGVALLEQALARAGADIAAAYRAGGRVLAAGNGGSAAEAQHLTGELLGRLRSDRERVPLGAVVLSADTSALTAIGNDYGYASVFRRQVEGLGRPGDVLVALSTSGSSPNLVAAVESAEAMGLVTVGLLGRGPSPLHERCGHVLAVPADEPGTVQECHLLLVHALVEAVEDALGVLEVPALNTTQAARSSQRGRA